jgi:ribonuclease BN (tRNA processing enzyme)
VEPVAVEHPVPAYALRVHADGRLLVYTGDSGVCEPVEHAAEGADLFLAEAAFCDGEDNPEGIHLTGTDVGNMAKRAGVGRLVLTHIPAWHDPQVSFDEARAVWDGPLDLATAGATYDV